MSEETIETKQPANQLPEMLLVLDKQQQKIQAVKGIDKNGKLETVEPLAEKQKQFMRIDKHGNLVSNFLSNFFNQLKDPTRFSFFGASVTEAPAIANKLQKHLEEPTQNSNNMMEKYEIKKEHFQQNLNTMDESKVTEEKEYRYQPEQINWSAMSEIGLSKERLEKLNLLDPLLKGYKTNELVPLNLNLGVATTRMDARLALQANDDGQVVLVIHGIRKEPALNFPFFGHEFSKEDKENLLSSGNMGRIVDLTNPRTQEIVPSIISIDRLTNELVALRVEKIKIPDEIKGVTLGEQQKQTLMEGKSLYLEGMISQKGEPFNANVQFNADKRYVEFLFERNNNRQVKNNSQTISAEAPRTVRGKELDDAQYQKFKEGETIYVTGLVDKQGKEYKGYLTFNKDTAKTNFSFKNPNKAKEQVQPAEENKTQVAINSEGKTNEATKNIREPLKSGQQVPDSKKQQEQQKESPKPAKTKGKKI